MEANKKPIIEALFYGACGCLGTGWKFIVGHCIEGYVDM